MLNLVQIWFIHTIKAPKNLSTLKLELILGYFHPYVDQSTPHADMNSHVVSNSLDNHLEGGLNHLVFWSYRCWFLIWLCCRWLHSFICLFVCCRTIMTTTGKNPVDFSTQYNSKAYCRCGKYKDVCPACHLSNQKRDTSTRAIELNACRHTDKHTDSDWTKQMLSGGTFRLYNTSGGGYTDYVVSGMTVDGLAKCEPAFPIDSNLLYYYKAKVINSKGGRYV